MLDHLISNYRFYTLFLLFELIFDARIMYGMVSYTTEYQKT